MEIIRSFMPEQLSEEETRKVCEKLVEELGCDGRKDIGRTMGALKERYAGEMDFAKASQIVKELLK